MSTTNRIRSQRILREAEGYLELNLAQSALDCLARLTEPGTFRGKQLFLQGEALRRLHRFPEASEVLEKASDLIPGKIDVWFALGWCLKRCGHLDRAIAALEHAREADPAEAMVYYNLACYFSLAGKKRDAVVNLTQAIEMRPGLRDMVNDESDFDAIRSDPDFQAIMTVIV